MPSKIPTVIGSSGSAPPISAPPFGSAVGPMRDVGTAFNALAKREAGIRAEEAKQELAAKKAQAKLDAERQARIFKAQRSDMEYQASSFLLDLDVKSTDTESFLKEAEPYLEGLYSSDMFRNHPLNYEMRRSIGLEFTRSRNRFIKQDKMKEDNRFVSSRKINWSSIIADGPLIAGEMGDYSRPAIDKFVDNIEVMTGMIGERDPATGSYLFPEGLEGIRKYKGDVLYGSWYERLTENPSLLDMVIDETTGKTLEEGIDSGDAMAFGDRGTFDGGPVREDLGEGGGFTFGSIMIQTKRKQLLKNVIEHRDKGKEAASDYEKGMADRALVFLHKEFDVALKREVRGAVNVIWEFKLLDGDSGRARTRLGGPDGDLFEFRFKGGNASEWNHLGGPGASARMSDLAQQGFRLGDVSVVKLGDGHHNRILVDFTMISPDGKEMIHIEDTESTLLSDEGIAAGVLAAHGDNIIGANKMPNALYPNSAMGEMKKISAVIQYDESAFRDVFFDADGPMPPSVGVDDFVPSMPPFDMYLKAEKGDFLNAEEKYREEAERRALMYITEYGSALFRQSPARMDSQIIEFMRDEYLKVFGDTADTKKFTDALTLARTEILKEWNGNAIEAFASQNEDVKKMWDQARLDRALNPDSQQARDTVGRLLVMSNDAGTRLFGAEFVPSVPDAFLEGIRDGLKALSAGNPEALTAVVNNYRELRHLSGQYHDDISEMLLRDPEMADKAHIIVGLEFGLTQSAFGYLKDRNYEIDSGSNSISGPRSPFGTDVWKVTNEALSTLPPLLTEGRRDYIHEWARKYVYAASHEKEGVNREKPVADAAALARIPDLLLESFVDLGSRMSIDKVFFNNLDEDMKTIIIEKAPMIREGMVYDENVMPFIINNETGGRFLTPALASEYLESIEARVIPMPHGSGDMRFRLWSPTAGNVYVGLRSGGGENFQIIPYEVGSTDLNRYREETVTIRGERVGIMNPMSLPSREITRRIPMTPEDDVISTMRRVKDGVNLVVAPSNRMIGTYDEMSILSVRLRALYNMTVMPSEDARREAAIDALQPMTDAVARREKDIE